MFGRKHRREIDSDLVTGMNVSILLNKSTGERYISLDGEFIDEDTFRLVMSPNLAKQVINTMREQMEAEGL